MTPFDPKAPAHSPGELAFSDVYRSHAVFVWRCLRRFGVREADVEDVCQETFVTAHRKFVEFDGRSTLRTWLCGIAVRKASEYRRKRMLRSEQPWAEPPDAASAPSQLKSLARQEARAILDEVLDRLDDDKRAVFVLYELEQLSMAEVAETLGCPVQTAYSRLHAARRAVEIAVRRFRLQEEAL